MSTSELKKEIRDAMIIAEGSIVGSVDDFKSGSTRGPAFEESRKTPA